MRLWDNAAALKRLSRWLYVCVMLCLLGAAGVWLVNSPYFPIKRVQIERPVKRADAAQVQRIARQYLYGNIFKADVNAAQAAFARLPWIAKAQVKRIWPDTVVVSLTEQVPVAYWGESALVSSEGVVFEAPSHERFPVFVAGGGKPDRAVAMQMVTQLAKFQAALKPVGLAVAELHYSERLAWTLVLDNGVVVRLGREDTDTRLRHFVWAWPRVLRSQADNIDYVDMRYKDGFALRQRAEGQAAAVE